MSVHMMGLSGSIQVFDKSVWGGGLSDLNAYKASGGGGGGGRDWGESGGKMHKILIPTH